MLPRRHELCKKSEKLTCIRSDGEDDEPKQANPIANKLLPRCMGILGGEDKPA